MRTKRIKQTKTTKLQHPTETACIIAKLGVEYLTEHRKQWGLNGGYLKPYYKGTITKTINNLNEIINKYQALPTDAVIKRYNEKLLARIVGELIKVRELKLQETDTLIFETMIVGSICLGGLEEMVPLLDWKLAHLVTEIKKVTKTFRPYKKFWCNEVDLTILKEN